MERLIEPSSWRWSWDRGNRTSSRDNHSSTRQCPAFSGGRDVLEVGLAMNDSVVHVVDDDEHVRLAIA